MMQAIIEAIARELSIESIRVENTLNLLQEGATIPFIARYRKEKTANLDETQLRNIEERYQYLTELAARKEVIKAAIAKTKQLTPELAAKIDACWQKNQLEDLYLPYKAKKRTKAAIAKEKGLENLAKQLQSLNTSTSQLKSLTTLAESYCQKNQLKLTGKEALEGASDIIAEATAEKLELRNYVRDYLAKNSQVTTKIKKEYPEGSTKYEMYRDFQMNIKKMSAHHFLAILRGESEGILTINLDYDQEEVLGEITVREIKTKSPELKKFYQQAIADGFKRLLEPAIIREIRAECKEWADITSIKTFEANLRELLLSPPVGMKPTLGIDPGFRTGCKVAVLSETGKFCAYQVIYPHSGNVKSTEASKIIIELIEKYQIKLIGIGNGTASRETIAFIQQTVENLTQKPEIVTVNESGASIYSASKVAIAEFPDLDVTIRGAISIGRRLQDPLAELVKIEPKSLGVGQYQHDVSQKLLKKKLEETVESCVNYVGVDLNTASGELLGFVSGISPSIANNIVKYREANGAFSDRQQLLEVPKLGNKAFEQAAGFLRIRNGDNPLDNTAVHPESYYVAKNILAACNVSLQEIHQISNHIDNIDLQQFVSDQVGLPTLKDVCAELAKPGRDPRNNFSKVNFKPGIEEIEDLEVGMELEGVVTNVVNFGAFVDIGVHQDGLVHISELANHFVEDTQTVVKVGQIVQVKVLDVNITLRRISLSMKAIGNVK